MNRGAARARGGSSHNGATQSGTSTDVGNGLNWLNELWVGWNDPRAGL